MDSKQYVAKSLSTESKPERLNFGTVATDALLGVMISSGELVDCAKKVMFYGKAPDLARLRNAATTLVDMGNFFAELASNFPEDLTNPEDYKGYAELAPHLQGLELSNINKRLMHASMGLFTESGETAEAIVNAWRAGTQPDRVNFAEELGDGFWYAALAADELGVSFETLFDQNVSKLQDKRDGRYKQGEFNVDAANERNLAAERSNLEGSLVKPVSNDEQELIFTSSKHICYSRNTEQFVLFDETEVELSRHDSFNEAVEAQNIHAGRLNGVFAEPPFPVAYGAAKLGAEVVTSGVHSPGHVDHTPSSVIPQPSVADRAKGYAVKALDAVDTGIDKAKDYLTRK